MARVLDARAKPLGTGYINPHTLICLRLLTGDITAEIDADWFARRLNAALALRARLYPTPHYRLVFGEADGLPGLVIDRYDDVLAVQITTAGMELLKPALLEALKIVLKPRGILISNDLAMRETEGLPQIDEVIGEVPDEIAIIESGLDIPRANTMIIERADTLGLSQLHQLRGRVGRGRERAYAYFLYDPQKPLGEVALERLKAVATHNELGAGMQLAMKDLEIRGAGNLLGGEQSGHIAGVGFDLYVRMVGEAVADFKGEGESAPAEVKIELPVDAHLPHEYVPGERLRLEAYKKLASAESEADLAEIVEELTDRYGEPPEPVRNLVEVARLRIVVRSAGLTDVVAVGNNVRFAPVQLRESQQLRLARLYPKSSYKEGTRTVLVPKPTTARIGGTPLRDTDVLTWASDLVRQVMLDDVIVDPGATAPRDTSRSR